MKFLYFNFDMTLLTLSVLSGNQEIVKLLLKHPKIDVNQKIIFVLSLCHFEHLFWMKFQIIFFF